MTAGIERDPASGLLGAAWDGEGVRFTLYSRHAEAIDLCLFEEIGPDAPERHLPLSRGPGHLWSLYVPGLAPGQLYGYRVQGPYRPREGHRFNPAKLLTDPRAGALRGGIWHPSQLGSEPGGAEDTPSGADSAPWAPRSVVVDPRFDWGADRPPAHPWEETVLYECHVRGLTRLHPQVPENLRGTFLGLASEPVIAHLQALGVTAVELMPVSHFFSERHLTEAGRVNYWGYSPLGLFAPHAPYATLADGGQVLEFKRMVRRLHRAGLEVIVDMVLNHTAEGDAAGPTLSLRGVDNAVYYRLDGEGGYLNWTGCGNTLDASDPEVARLLVDALRYWVEEMRVDGFRLDLASTLGRAGTEFSLEAPFFRALAAEPSLAGVKLIAEPWDATSEGYRLGGFPAGWAEWNDRYRDRVRAFWRGDGSGAVLARRLTGSPDLFSARAPLASVNFVTCHDGFTLEDLVSYEEKRNWDNGEENRDGTSHNLSRNWGVEGPTGEPEVLEPRARAQRNFLATLALSAGVPLIGHGDEMGRSQQGNNNAYCQDGPLSWVDWELGSGPRRNLLEFARAVFQLRRRLGWNGRLQGADLRWIGPDGEILDPGLPGAWGSAFGAWIAKADLPTLLLLCNGGDELIGFRLPPASESGWCLLLASAEPPTPGRYRDEAGLEPYSLILLEADPPG